MYFCKHVADHQDARSEAQNEWSYLNLPIDNKSPEGEVLKPAQMRQLRTEHREKQRVHCNRLLARLMAEGGRRVLEIAEDGELLHKRCRMIWPAEEKGAAASASASAPPLVIFKAPEPGQSEQQAGAAQPPSAVGAMAADAVAPAAVEGVPAVGAVAADAVAPAAVDGVSDVGAAGATPDGAGGAECPESKAESDFPGYAMMAKHQSRFVLEAKAQVVDDYVSDAGIQS